MLQSQKKHRTFRVVQHSPPAQSTTVRPQGQPSRMRIFPPTSHSELSHTLLFPRPPLSQSFSISSPSKFPSLCFLSWSPSLVLESFKSPVQLFPSCLVSLLGGGRRGRRGGKPQCGLVARWQLTYFSFWMIQMPKKHKLSHPAKADMDFRLPCPFVLSLWTWISCMGLLNDPFLSPGP